MSNENTAQRNEELRRAVLEVLAARHPAALTKEAIRRRLTNDQLIDWNPTDDQLASALAFTVSQEWLETYRDQYGATQYWRATAAGILTFERGV